MEAENYLWWQGTIIYQIYPRSYQDSNGDGIGDLKGILQRLDYLQWLGIESIWLSPLFPSPMADFGYDVSNYSDIHPIFGTLADFDELLGAVHARGMKLILDLVPNHTSDKHPWFKASRTSKSDPKRDWYIWQDAREDGSEPNNWLSVFGGSGWQWDEHTEQYYYHGFLKEQPDLNWRNPEVVSAMLGEMRFWLARGVDGFRVDVIWHMIKDEKLRDNPQNPGYLPHMPTYDQLLPVFSTDQPVVHAIVRQMRQLVNEYDDRLLIGEIYLPIPKLMTYYGEQHDEVHLPFNFMLLAMEWDAKQISEAISTYEAALPANAWPNWVLGNHDRPRLATRIGAAQTKVAAMLLLTLRGTPTIYYGDEIGMKDVDIPIDEIQDPQGLNMPELNLSRDPVRTPMQWSSSQNAGFTTAKPWLRVAPDFAEHNVAQQRGNCDSELALHRKLIQLRQHSDSLRYGDYAAVFSNDQILAFTRNAASDFTYLIVLNLTDASATFESDLAINGVVQVGTHTAMEGKSLGNCITLRPNEGMVIKLTES
jgi:alpha-glucosidase